MIQRLLATVLVILGVAGGAQAKPKEKIYNNTADQVFQAALRTARERHVITYVDDKHYMFTFETGTSLTSYGFNANASVEDAGEGTAKLIINVQKKNDAKAMSWSLGAGDRMADKFFEQVAQELGLMSSQRVAVKPDASHVEAPPSAQMAGAAQTVQIGTSSETGAPEHRSTIVAISSAPAGADIYMDRAFVGNTPSTLNVSGGKHSISVRKQGYQDWVRDMGFSGGTITLNAELISGATSPVTTPSKKQFAVSGGSSVLQNHGEPVHLEGSPGWIGISTKKSARDTTVTYVTADGPASKAGLRVGDVITELNGNHLSDEDFESQIAKYKSGSRITIGYTRTLWGFEASVVVGTNPH